MIGPPFAGSKKVPVTHPGLQYLAEVEESLSLSNTLENDG